MKRLFFLLAVFFLIFSCKKEVPSTTDSGWTKISNHVKFKNSGGSVDLVSGKHSYHFAEGKIPFKKIIFLNSSLLGYISELGAEESISAVSSPEYIYSEKINNLIKSKKIATVGNEQKYDVEKIIALKPDAVVTNYISTFENTYDLLRKNGIEIIFLDEYLEQDPLEKAAYLKVFGLLTGRQEFAEKRFREIADHYQKLKNSASRMSVRPLVIANEMYGNQWFLPGGKTSTAALIGDAGADYILRDSQADKSVPMSFEEVFVKAEDAKFWVNVGSHTKKSELLAVNPNYAKMKVYQSGEIFSISKRERGRANDFFESGNVRADLVLMDYVAIFHPEILPGYSTVYMEKLK